MDTGSIERLKTYKQTKDQDWPEQKSGRLSLRLSEFDTQAIESRSQTTDTVVGEEGERTDAGKGDVLLPARPAQRIVWIVGVRPRVQNNLGVACGRVQLHSTLGIVEFLERTETHRCVGGRGDVE